MLTSIRTLHPGTIPFVSSVKQPFEEVSTNLSGPSFIDFVKGMAESTLTAVKNGESAARQAALGMADPQKVAFDMVNATTAVRQFTTLLPAAVQAYQEIYRMPL